MQVFVAHEIRWSCYLITQWEYKDANTRGLVSFKIIQHIFNYLVLTPRKLRSGLRNKYYLLSPPLSNVSLLWSFWNDAVDFKLNFIELTLYQWWSRNERESGMKCYRAIILMIFNTKYSQCQFWKKEWFLGLFPFNLFSRPKFQLNFIRLQNSGEFEATINPSCIS